MNWSSPRRRVLTLKAFVLLMAITNPYQWSKQAARDPGKMDLELQKIQRAFGEVIADGHAGHFTRVTFTEDLYSVTTYATPSLTSGTYESYFNATNGAVLQGYGGTYDVALLNRSGSVALGISAGTTTVTIPGTLNVAGTIAFSNTTDATNSITGAVTVAGGVGVAKSLWTGTTLNAGTALTFTTLLSSTTALATPATLGATAAQMWASAVSGLALRGFGSVNDVALMRRDGTVVAGVLANTTTFHVTGTLTGAGAATMASTITSQNGGFVSQGASSQYGVFRRDNNNSAWAIYSTAGSLQFFDNVAGVDKVTMLQGGAIQFVNAATSGFAVGPNGSTNPAFQIDTSVGSLAAGLKLTGATSAGTVALAVISSGSNANLSINAKGSGTITLGDVSTGAITHTRATTLSAALTYGGVTLSNSVTGTGSMVLSDSPTFTGTVTVASVSVTNATVTGTLTLTGATVAGAPTWSSGQAITLTTASQPNVTTMANLTTIGTLVAGAVPASLVTAGVFPESTSWVFGTSASKVTVKGAIVIGTDPGGTNELRIAGAALVSNSGAGVTDVWSLYNANTTDSNGVRFNFTTDTTGSGATARFAYANFRGRAITHDNATVLGELAVQIASAGAASARWQWGGTVGAAHYYPSNDNTGDLGGTVNRVRTGYFGTSVVVGTTSVAGTVAVGSGVTTENLNATITVNAGTHSAANDKDAYYGVQRGGTALWRMGVLGSVSADANWTLRDVVNSKSSIVVAPNGGGATFDGSLTTAAPTTGTAGAWKLGIRVAATVALDTTQYIQLDVGGTLFKLAVVT